MGQAGTANAATGAFRWPPRPPLDRPASTPPQPAPAPGAADTPWLLEVERVWLEPVALPLARRAAAMGWASDTHDAYCDRCGATVGPFEGEEFGCAACAGRRPAWDRFVRLGAYDGPLRTWVQEVKFTRWWRLGVDLGRTLGRAAREAGLHGENTAVVPVACSRRRRLSRGIDHARALATGVAEALEAPLVDALSRRHRPSQRSLPPSARRSNVAGAFAPLAGVDLRGWRVALVDDVLTTGATMAAAARALRGGARRGSAGRTPRALRPEVWACVAAVTPDPGRRAAGGGGGVGRVIPRRSTRCPP